MERRTQANEEDIPRYALVLMEEDLGTLKQDTTGLLFVFHLPNIDDTTFETSPAGPETAPAFSLCPLT